MAGEVPSGMRAEWPHRPFAGIADVQRSGVFDADTAAALALGMKLFGEVMLQHRKDPLFEPIVEPYRGFIGAFKARMKAANTPSDG
ncbi:DUF3861 family protein [Massilia sp. 9096]|uniref:DUF3861 family protein n=1 Tax=Massilia sp. 9096 TaxID=1500894 RepID=UPI0009DDF846|nr:DUF3861 family protein [Massilia sp. 9096]